MRVTIQSTNKEYRINRLMDYGVLHNIMEFTSTDYAGTALFKASIETEDGEKTVIGKAKKGILLGEVCDNLVDGIVQNKDIRAILSLKDTLFKGFDSREVYMIGKKVQQPDRFDEKMTFDKAIEALVNKAQKRIEERIETKKEALLARDESLVVTEKPAYNLGDSFALITMGFVCAPIKVVRRLAVVDYDTGEVNFLYNLKTDYPSGKPEPINWDKVEEKQLKEWAHSSNYDIKKTKKYEQYREYVGRFNNLVNITKEE